jgi:hypothetical protein
MHPGSGVETPPSFYHSFWLISVAFPFPRVLDEGVWEIPRRC